MPRDLDRLFPVHGRPLLCDGAMGTQLIARGLRMGSCAERWNTDHAEDVRAIHADYAAAGCDLLTSNTFGGTRLALARHGIDAVRELNLAGAGLAREAARQTAARVLGDIGPIGELLEPYGEITHDAAREAYAEQARALLEGGADALLVETMADPAEMALALRACREAGGEGVILLATATFGPAVGGVHRTIMGASPRECVDAALDAGADVVGANCGTSLTPDDYVALARDLVAAAAGRAPVIVQPNAGAPRDRDGKIAYDATPAGMAELAARLLDAGVRIVGGCCGTSPAHLAAMRGVVK